MSAMGDMIRDMEKAIHKLEEENLRLSLGVGHGITHILKMYHEANCLVIRNNLTDLLILNKLTSSDLQNLLGVSRHTAASYRAKRPSYSTKPDLINILVICEYLHVDPLSLFS